MLGALQPLCTSRTAQQSHAPHLCNITQHMLSVSGALFATCSHNVFTARVMSRSGNITQFIRNVYASGERFQKKMDETNEFLNFHNVSPRLQAKVRSYIEFAYHVTKGLNVETIAQQLPNSLQVEVYMELNRKMLGQVPIFAACPPAFIKAIVTRLQTAICVDGENIFRKGDAGAKIYFVKRGSAEVVLENGKCVATFGEGSFFGEIALVSDVPRTATVRATTDCTLLTLSRNDLEQTCKAFPTAMERIQTVAKARYAELLKADAVKSEQSDRTSFARRRSSVRTTNERLQEYLTSLAGDKNRSPKGQSPSAGSPTP